ncbi:SEL1-like repeat protein [Methylogaea oryzae]|uniref:SEL1-like repeat protein n=1 Tax=Methylogaea oryzae TaxID=1295382 RepID=UPI0006D0A964|nr:SEL1-like repeat protein [Methylogaea oryzae]
MGVHPMGGMLWPAGLLLAWLALAGPGGAQAAESGNGAAYAAIAKGDYAAARSIWSTLAGQGDAEAQYNLGVMYSRGDGGGQDLAKAVKWFQRRPRRATPRPSTT